MSNKNMTDQTRNMDANTLRGMLAWGEPVTVLDVRKQEERDEWQIPGSVHVDAYDALNRGDERALDGAELEEGAPVVTVCGRGRSSAIAAEMLGRQGYDVYSLEGGMQAFSLAWNIATVEVPGSGAEVLQVRRAGKGCLSYMIFPAGGAGGEATVIDAAVAPEVYLQLAEERNLDISKVLDTHVHADHLSRSRKLAELTGAQLYMPEGSPVSYPFTPLADGDTLAVSESELKVVSTPGHTPESTSYLLDGAALFTGDTLFLSAVGRPDLGADAEKAREKARALHGSLQRLLELSPDTLILPGHTSEPLAFDGRPVMAALGEVHARTGVLDEPENGFVERLAGKGSEVPENHERIVALNRAGELPDADPTELEGGANRCAAG